LPSSQDQIRQHLQSAHRQVARLSDDIHNLAYELHPSLLGDVGLEGAMRDHLSSFQKRTGLQLTFSARRVPREVPRPIAGSLYRIVQESLNNIAKHANAT